MTQVDNVGVFTQLLCTIEDIIGRRSSEHYAVVMINDVLNQLAEQYPVLTQTSIKNSQFTESPELIIVNPDINTLAPLKFKEIVIKLLLSLTSSIGKTAGHFFLKELKETIGSNYEQALENIGVDLGFMHFQQLIDKRPKPMQLSDSATVLSNVLESLLDIISKETTSDLAYSTVTYYLSELSLTYEFFKSVTIKDIRYTQTNEVVSVAISVNAVDPTQVGASIQELLINLQKWFEAKDFYALIPYLTSRLKEEDLLSLEIMGVNFNAVQISHEAVFKHIMKALINVLGKASTPQYAVFAIDMILRKLDPKYNFLQFVKIDSSRYTDGAEAISIMTDIDAINPSDAGRGIQKLVEETVKTLGEELGPQFVDELKRNIGKVYLTRMEEMGVNLHIIQLRRDLISLRRPAPF